MNRLLFIIIICISCTTLKANNYNNYLQVLNLNGNWKFTIGDNKQYANTNFDHKSWTDVYVPSSWENQGFPGYDGFAWYRKEFKLSVSNNTAQLTLFLGYIDDVDEVYFNGVKIGHNGSFPPNYWTAYKAERRYLIPNELVKHNQTNVIAVRVYDSQIDGGIIKGPVGIYASQNALPFIANFEGYWKFFTGDNPEFSNQNFDDSKWYDILVPSTWEDQIAPNYNGFGWYRKQFKISFNDNQQRFVLCLGKIDDFDQVFINGKLVAQTGNITNTYPIKTGDEYRKQRFYYLNPGDIMPDKVNTIAVRVYDSAGEGGIYEGPVGLVELKNFVTYMRNNR